MKGCEQGRPPQSIEPDPRLVELIKRKIATFEPDQILEAIRLTEGFPPPGPYPADVIAQVLHDVALHAESLQDWPLCAALYLRSLAYPVANQSIAIGNWFRYALCQERAGALREAIAGYRRALACGEAWPHVTALARKHLAELLMAAEEFEEAAALLSELMRALPHPDIERDEIELRLARCLIRLDQAEEARQHLEAFCSRPLRTEAAVEAYQLLAAIYEQSKRTSLAIACYQRIVESSAAEPNIRAAAAYRIATLLNLG